MKAIFVAFGLMAQSGSVFGEGFVEPFTEGIGKDWYVANYIFSHPYFDTDWRAENVLSNRGLTLNLHQQKDQENGFSGASIRRNETSGFGTYRARMKAAKGSGIVTGFFLYTGPYYGTQHDEIDVEILGHHPSKLHVAWFVNGELHNHFVDLGFDATDCFHDYEINWRPDSLAWRVNGKLLFETNSARTTIPKTPARLFLNLWAADHAISGWAGKTKPGTAASAIVEKVSFVPETQELTN